MSSTQTDYLRRQEHKNSTEKTSNVKHNKNFSLPHKVWGQHSYKETVKTDGVTVSR